MITSTSGRSGRRIGGFLSIIILVAMALLVAAPSISEAKAKLWLYPDSDDPRAGGHVVTVGEFTLFVENRGTGGGDNTAYEAMLVFAVNDPALLIGGSLTLPDGTVVPLDSVDLALGTPSLPCSLRPMAPHSQYPAFFTTLSIGNIEQGETVEIAVDIVGEDGLKVHFDATARGEKLKKEAVVCYDVVNPFGHDVTVILGDTGDTDCPDVEINKSADITGVDIGDPVVYTIEIVNTGDCDLTDVVVTEDIPTVIDPATGDLVPAFTVTAIDPPPVDPTGDPITWFPFDLLAGETATFTVSVIFDQPLADGQEVVNTACVTTEGIEECSSVEVAVGQESADGDIGGPGFWCNRIRFAVEGKHNATYTVEELEAFLAEINTESGVFSELYDTSILELAQNIVCHPQEAESAADRLARHLLTLWFNIVSERINPEITLAELCPGDEELPDGADGEMTVDEVVFGDEVVLGAEGELLADPPDEALLEWWKDVIDFINNSSVGPCEGAEEAAPEPRRLRGRHLGRRGPS